MPMGAPQRRPGPFSATPFVLLFARRGGHRAVSDRIRRAAWGGMGVRIPEGSRPGDGQCIAALALLAAALFRKALLGGAVILSHPVFLDLTHQVYAYRLYGFGLLRKGIVPLWNPYNFCGAPFIANWHSAIFYPPNAVFLFLPVHTALNWSIAFHFFLAAALTYAFVRLVGAGRAGALLSAAVFVLSGPYILHLFPGHVFNPLPWLPLALICGEMAVRRRRAVWHLLAGVVLGVQVLAGHPQYMLYCAAAEALYILFRAASECRGEGGARPLAAAAAGILLMAAAGAALSAVQLLPGLEYAAHSGRAALAGPETVRENSLPPENLALLAVPGLFGDMRSGRYWGRWLYWETCLYVGILPLSLAVIGAARPRPPATRFFSGLALLSVVLALGAYSPFFGFLYAHVPVFSLFRAQAKFTCLASFSLAVLAGFGLRALLDGASRRLAAAGGLAAVAAGILLASLVAATASAGGGESRPWGAVVEYRAARGFEGTPPIDPADAAARGAAYRTAARGALAAAALLVSSGALLLAAGRMRPGLLAALALALSLGDLWRFGARYITTSPLEACRWPPALTARVRRECAGARICTPNIAVPGAMQNMNERIPAVDGYETVNIGPYKDYVDAAQGVARGSRLAFAVGAVAPMIEALNLGVVILPAGARCAAPRFSPVFTDGRATVYRRDPVVPRAFVVHRSRVIPDPAAALAALRGRGADVRGEVVLDADPSAAASPPPPGAPPEDAEIVAEGPNELRLRATLASPGYLVVSDAYYPGWRAYADGRETRILRANYAFRAIHLEEGIHEVRFVYAPRSFRRGALTSAAAACACAVFIARARRISRMPR